jgi:hypothetical protein
MPAKRLGEAVIGMGMDSGWRQGVAKIVKGFFEPIVSRLPGEADIRQKG